jgi:predicted nucleic acid-binding protein
LEGCAAQDLFISMVSIGEIERGICKVADTVFARALERWLEDLLRLYGDRILPVTATIVRRWGQLSARLGHDGADLLIAATALLHGLTVATRNVRLFVPAGVPVTDPFASP